MCSTCATRSRLLDPVWGVSLAAWAWLAIMGGILALGGLALGVLALWRQYKRNTVLGLIGRREELVAARRSLRGGRSASSRRATTPRSCASRRIETTSTGGRSPTSRGRRRYFATSSISMPLPDEAVSRRRGAGGRCLVPGVRSRASRWEPNSQGDSRDARSSRSLRFDAAVRAADASITAACTACHIEDRAVYGGGLYI